MVRISNLLNGTEASDVIACGQTPAHQIFESGL